MLVEGVPGAVIKEGGVLIRLICWFSCIVQSSRKIPALKEGLEKLHKELHNLYSSN